MPNGTYGGVRGRKTKVGRKLLRFPPTRLKHSTVRSYAFTEQGVAMLSTILRSETAIRVSIRIMDAGQVYDAYTFVSDLIKSAKKRIVLIDNYVDETVLTLVERKSHTFRSI